MKDFDPATVKTFQVEGRPRNISGNAVLEPTINSDNMKAVLAVFRGEARIADAPDLPPVDPTATTAPGTSAGGPTTSTPTGSSSGGTTSTTAPTSTLPIVAVDENIKGLYPPRDLSCR